MAEKFDLKAIISAVDKMTPVLKGVQRSVKLTHKTIRDVGRAGGELLSKVGISAAAMTGGIAFAVKKIVDVSAEFERYRTILETIEGSSDKAQRSMDWVQNFAVKTPYELAQVTDAFVKLKAYGIDPQAGALDAAGNAAAAMGKDVMQAVEALADAMTGENERLKEFGIKASKTGDQIVYTWTENGKTMAAKARASSKEQIEAVITGIWNRRFGGAMYKLSNTWTGTWSNMMDQVTKFVKQIGDAGVFDSLKGQLKGILKQFEVWEKDGTLKKVAQEISDGLVKAVKEVALWVKSVDWKAFMADVKATLIGIRDLVAWLGGMKNVLIGIGVIFLAGPLAAIMSIIGSVWRLGAGLLALVGGWAKVAAAIRMVGMAFVFVARLFLLNPIGLAVTAIAAAAYAVYKNWDGIKSWFSGFFAWMAGKVKAIGDWFKGLVPDWARNWFAGKAPPAPQQGATPLNRSGALQLAAGRQQLTGDMTVRFENAPPGMRVNPGKTNQPGVSMNPDVGYRSLALMAP